MKGMVYVMKHINVKERFQNKIKDLKKHSKKYYIIESIRKLIMLCALCVFTYFGI